MEGTSGYGLSDKAMWLPGWFSSSSPRYTGRYGATLSGKFYPSSTRQRYSRAAALFCVLLWVILLCGQLCFVLLLFSGSLPDQYVAVDAYNSSTHAQQLLLPHNRTNHSTVSTDQTAHGEPAIVVMSVIYPLIYNNVAGNHAQFTGANSTRGGTRLLRTQLPSWTLRHVEAECAECLDSETHAAAVRRQGGAAGAAVFATAAAPLGIAGPMLFAMASVTDDVDGAAELARWSWVPRSYAMRRQFSGASPAGLRGGTSPYLVVLGIPSTDQPVRATLRDAQRATWLSYREVARSGNDFRGALLPLYLFAAAERDQRHGVTDVSPLLPTVAEYEAASVARLHAKGGAVDVSLYEERRVRLVEGFGSLSTGEERITASPCAQVVSRRVSRSLRNVTAAHLAWVSRLGLPVSPAAVAPAQFICHASAALWQEVLRHRNAVWIDMMTDRKPTSKKKLGQGGNWGPSVEVGMTQKTILWLHYAYHAFPDVPYIMKGDDDTYLKVPQFLRDMRHIRSNYTDVFPEAAPAVRDPPGIEKTEECIYWGSWVRNPFWDGLRYHGGNGYLLHRRLVRVVVGSTDRLTKAALDLAVLPYDGGKIRTYRRFLMTVEDAHVGSSLRRKKEEIRKICPHHRAVYVEEPRSRLVSTETGVKTSWATVLLHHVTPFDQYYLHYYFQHEHAVAAEDGRQSVCVRSNAARAAAVRWMRAVVPRTMHGAGRYTRTEWTHPADIPASVASVGDNVSVYAVRHALTDVRALDLGMIAEVPEIR